MSRLLLGIDLGTSYFKVGLFDEQGTLAGLGRVAVEPLTPRPGRCELPVNVFWKRLRQALADALQQAGTTAHAVCAISYSSQANTFVLLDERDVPLTALICWTDVRGPVPAQFQAFSRTETFHRTVGFAGVSAESAVTKWAWLQDQEPALVNRVRSWMTISDYLTFALTGERKGDESTAALTGFYDLLQRRHWGEALDVFRINPATLSEPLQSGTPCGRTVPRAMELLGVPKGIPFAVGGLDHHIAALGAGLGRFADVSISTGTVLAATCLVDRVEPISGCFHGGCAEDERYFRLAFDPEGAGQLDRYQRQTAPDRTIGDLIALAAKAGAPQALSPDSDGRDIGRGARQVLEQIGMAHRELVQKVSQGQPVRMISATGGGARSLVWIGIKANILNIPIATLACPERACLGAAVLAAAAAGTHAGLAEAALAMVHCDRVIMPEPDAVERYARTERRG